MREAIYVYEAGGYRPTRWAGSPWSTSMQHGGPVIGLLAREAERVGAATGLTVARLTVDLFKAVPMQPLAVTTRVLREGRHVTALETLLHPPRGEDRPVSRASALLLRPSPREERLWETADTPPPPATEAGPVDHAGGRSTGLPPGFHQKVELRSGVDDAGPFVWLTTALDLVEGEPISALQRAAALTDMTLGTQMRMAGRRSARSRAGATRRDAWMINVDTTVYWERPFVGESLGIRPALITERDGIGTAEAVLYDAEGRVGRSLQCALLRRPGD